jgi:ubiquinone/menaquinone biosynthesis C-methylase UbiE
MHQKYYRETADIETASDDYASRFSGHVGRYFLNVQNSITLNFLKDMPGAAILDVGGGHAQLARLLLDNGYRLTVTGSADICRRRLDMTCEKGSFNYLTCNCFELPFADNQFDVVIAFRLLPHTVQWQGLIEEMCRVSRKRIIFDYPDKRSANILYNVLFDLKKNLEGNTRTYKLFNRREIRDQLALTGFGSLRLNPEFFLPMVIHRKLKMAGVSRFLEFLFRMSGFTRFFGSPIIISSDLKTD